MINFLDEFNGSIERIRNNFYFSFLALNFVNQRPFNHDVILPVHLLNNILTAASINKFDLDGANEYGNSIRRHFLNDLVIAYERYSTLMIASHHNGQVRTEPATIMNRHISAHLFEQLSNIFTEDEKLFLIQLRRLRNSIVHYNGTYSVSNVLNYSFGTNAYNSLGKEGQAISIEFDNIIWIYDELKKIVTIGNTNYFLNHQKP